jgi:hypothetical protein
MRERLYPIEIKTVLAHKYYKSEECAKAVLKGSYVETYIMTVLALLYLILN